MSSTKAHINQHKKDVGAAKERIALFKAAWVPKKRAKDKTDMTKIFTCSDHHVLCKPVEPVLCKCARRPVVEAETVDLYSYPVPVDLVVHPDLDSNQPYLDLLHHSPFHRTLTDISHSLTVTFADVAASAGNLNLLRHLFTSPDQCVHHFYADLYSYRDPTALLKLFVHALNGGCQEVVTFLVEKFLEELTSDLKIAILEACLWLATTEKNVEMFFQQLVLKFGVNIVNSANIFCPLRLTCMYDNGDAAGFLIDHGADMYAVNANGNTVAYQAYKYGRHTFGLHRVLRTMLDKGLNMEAVMVQGSHFYYPLMYTLLHHSEMDLVRHLVNCGHHVNLPIRICVDDQERCITPLMHALVCKCVKGAIWLIEQGADVNRRSFISQQLEDESWTPLHMAVTLGNFPIVKILIDRGAQIDAVTAAGETVLSAAVESSTRVEQEAFQVISYLIQMNAPVQSIPGRSFLIRCETEEAVKHKWTLLDLAVYTGNMLVADMLLKSGHFSQRMPKVSDFLHELISPISPMQINVVEMVEEFAAEVKVPTLQALCRDSLHGACGVRLLEYVSVTVMPARLRSYLLLEEVLGPIDKESDVKGDDDDV